MQILVRRPSDLPDSMRAKSEFSLPLAIIPGKHEPKWLHGYLQATLEDFKRYGPAGEIMSSPCIVRHDHRCLQLPP